MVQLQRIGKDKVINHHHDVPYKVLNKSYTFGDENSGNKIIHGDNLEALKSLLPQYEGKIDCIYIDPPYNTGNEGRVYNDNVNDPKIKKRLNEVVGKEGEDLSRHDKWLCMMYPRLKLLHKLLSDNGVMFISIDDNEQCNLKLLCDEIFGSRNFLVNMVINQAPAGTQSSTDFALQHAYCLVYKKTDQFSTNFIKLTEEELNKKYCDGEDELGKYYTERIRKRGIGGRMEDVPTLHFPVYFDEINNKIYIAEEADNLDKTKLIKIIPYQTVGVLGRWTWSKRKMIENRDHLIVKKVAGEWKLHKKVYSSDDIGKKPFSIVGSKLGRTELGSLELKNIMGGKLFDYPKFSGFIKYLLSLHEDQGALVLDSFAGSGTTAHAVLDLNKQDGGNRKFILVELGDYAENITAERVKRVIKGYGEGDKKVEGTGGGFDFYELGEPLFIDNETLNENVREETLRNYIWYTETKTEVQNAKKNNEYYLGTQFNTDYYFYYKKDEVTVLDLKFISTIAERNEQLIIYADKCILSKKFMQDYGIVFKKIPRDITRF